MSIMKFLLLAMTLTVVAGCAESSALIRANNTSMRVDVFEEITNGTIIPKGFADLHFTATLKTHKPGVYSVKDIHGTSDYKMLLNIDGQAVQLQGTLQAESSEATNLRDTEAGEGIRYRFDKKLRLKPGTHKVVLAIPADDLAIERVITLTDGSNNSLVLEPVYRRTPVKPRIGIGKTSYQEGIRGISLTLNGKAM